jgi:hypothetical protein
MEKKTLRILSKIVISGLYEIKIFLRENTIRLVTGMYRTAPRSTSGHPSDSVTLLNFFFDV